MPKGVYKRKPFTKEHKRKISEIVKRRYASREKFGFQKGHPNYLTEESKQKISESLKEQFKNGTRKPSNVKYWLGKKRSRETRNKISKANSKGGTPDCIDCGKKLKSYYAKRCVKCNGKWTGFKKRKEGNPNWKGGLKKGNYIHEYSPKHPNAKKNYVPQHRLVIEKHIGRYLEKWEYVHHRNGIKTDNRLENLEIVMNKVHYGKVSCPFCNKHFLIR